MKDDYTTRILTTSHIVTLILPFELVSEHVNVELFLIQQIRDMESGGKPLDAMIQELHTRNSHLKATLKALEREQLRSQFQNADLTQQKTELQGLIGKLCPADSGFCCCSVAASPRGVSRDKNCSVCRGGPRTARQESQTAAPGSGLENRDRVQDDKLGYWAANSARGVTFDGTESFRDYGRAKGKKLYTIQSKDINGE